MKHFSDFGDKKRMWDIMSRIFWSFKVPLYSKLLLFILFCFICLSSFSYALAAPLIYVSPTSIKFASTKADSVSAPFAISVKNNGTDDLVISGVTIDGLNSSNFGQNNDCTTLSAGNSCTINVQFLSSSPFGKKGAILNIASNDLKKPMFAIKLSGISPPPVMIYTKALKFAPLSSNTASSTLIATLQNTGISDLIISSISITGTNASEFSQTNDCSTLETGSSCSVNVTFTPQMPLGKKSAMLNISTNAPKKPIAIVKLSGTGPSSDVTCTSFTYSAWSVCQPNNTQTRTVTSSNPVGCTGGTPVLSQSCTYGRFTLPQTGQTLCYNDIGEVKDCAGTGQDGDIKAGIAWPNPRLVSGTGTEADCLIDTLTGLMWPKNGNLANGTKTWQGAIDFANGLNYCGHYDWRLPNINELESLVNVEVAYQPTWLNTQGFNIEQSPNYWSSSTSASSTQYAWVMSMALGGGFVVDAANPTSAV